MNIKQLAFAAALPLLFVACKKDEPADPTPTPPVQTGALALSVDLMTGMVPFDFNAAHTDGAGNNIRFTTLKFYMSGAKAMDDDGGQVAAFPDKYMLVDASDPASNNFVLGQMSGHVHELHFTLGLDDDTNYADPTLAEAPLNIPGMHWSWNPSAGYKFLNIEGFVDVNSNGTFEDGVDSAFAYHCAQNMQQGATDPVLRQTHVLTHADVPAGGTLQLELVVDVDALVVGLDFTDPPVSHGIGDRNQQLMDNLVNAISTH